VVTTSAVLRQNAEKLREMISRCYGSFGYWAMIKLAQREELIRRRIFECSTTLDKMHCNFCSAGESAKLPPCAQMRFAYVRKP